MSGTVSNVPLHGSCFEREGFFVTSCGIGQKLTPQTRKNTSLARAVEEDCSVLCPRFCDRVNSMAAASNCC